ncbi:SDR family oxidoreductase [Microvirga makkahensis]|uniref:SDR family oxidoreductase n=1 Tax=Microvirga makkahensis TaxID=1128670 RepID=A0A7X3MWQ1_9HYPH|nr:SDR family oxidoreductase [Microvirga makkahensis]MXQ14350.1 SDR family oxidoreductase [Microvirga makkahensis]
MDLELEGRRTLVIGASYGIGLASARMMAAEGADLILSSRSADKLDAAASDIGAACGRTPRTATVDLTVPGDAERLLNEVGAQWEGLDCLVTAVGGSIRSGFEGLSDEDWLGNYTFNVLSTVRAVRAALPLLRKGRTPAVVLLGAAAAKMPYAHQIVSNVHKAGLLGLSKTLAGEFASDGIRVNLVGPGRTLTPLWINRADKLAAERGVTRDEVIDEFSKDIPLGRFAGPEEVAVMVTWLASPRAAYVTGQAINVDGGIARGLL